MSDCSIGIDIGSVAVKGVLLEGSLLKTAIAPTGWNPRESALQVLHHLCQQRGISSPPYSMPLVATGYGRKYLECAGKHVTEITCHGRGVRHLAPAARTVLDIGGQDSKVILMNPHGGVENFAMNDKCAAGTGRFFQMMAHALEFSMEEFGAVSPEGEFQPISSMCAVFAESEVVGHLARGVPRESIVRGLLRSIASRSAIMLTKNGLLPPLFFSGGVSNSSCLRRLLEMELKMPVLWDPRSQFAGALGAARIGLEEKTNHGNRG